MHKATLILWAGLIAVTLQSRTVFAADAPANLRANVAKGQAIYNEGNGKAAACAGCHGETALGIDAMGASRLANIGQLYIFNQLMDYASDKRTDPDATMADIAKALSEQDSRDVAAYLDTLEYVTESSNLKELAGKDGKIGKPKRGETIMTEGIKPRVPACQDCHGLSGRAANIPAIHQQKYVYLVNQMKYYRDGSRANDREIGKVGIMRGIAKTLTDENIADISAYLSTYEP